MDSNINQDNLIKTFKEGDQEPLNTLLKVMSHDLRSPMAAIITLTDILQTESDSMEKGEIEETLKDLNRLSESLLNLTDQLLNWAKIMSNKEPLRLSYVSLSSIIAELIAEKQSHINQKNLKIVFTHPQSITLYSDRTLISSILRNLLTNAIKYSYEGGEILINLVKKDNENAEVSFIDHGTGISDKLLQKIYSKELLTSTPGTKGETGNGLGLFISTDFVRILSGSLLINSTKGEGTQTVVTFPMSTNNA
jgi:signal transduction histidine kinase